MKRLLSLLLCLFLLTACGEKAPTRFEKTYLDLFDTVCLVTVYAPDRATFDRAAQTVYDTLYTYHTLCDIYRDYEGLNNCKTVNDAAGLSPVKVDDTLFEFLAWAKGKCAASRGSVNIALGAVTSLWHEARDAAKSDPQTVTLPSDETLQEARNFCDLDKLILDETEKTAFLSERGMKLDVGALAKGYAAARAGEILKQSGLCGALNIGGTVVTTGNKPDGTPWQVGIQDPQNALEDKAFTAVQLAGKCLVTSGDYQRYFVANGVRYHHLIDPATAYPATHFKAVSVVCDDAGEGDLLSTALFLLPLDKGAALLAAYEGAEALWVTVDGKEIRSDGFAGYEV